MNDTVRFVRDFFVSLKLTVVLLALGIVLVFWATITQQDLGVWGVQQKFFHSFFVFGQIRGTEISVPIFPGGYFIGGLLLFNLIAAQIYRFKLSFRKSGIWLTHIGLILLLVGELLSGLWQQDFQMKVDEGESKNYADNSRYTELAIIDTSDPKFDNVVAIPEDSLANGASIQHPQLPFRVNVKAYYPNASIEQRGPGSMATPATTGIGERLAAIPLLPASKENERNVPAAYVELVGPDGSLGTWLVSSDVPFPQHFDFGGKSWKIVQRFARIYRPFSLTLIKFNHDVYPGTDIPKNFSSRLQLKTDDGREDREVLIYMNNPLRYAGLTFFQADYDHEREKYTILQVVRNPSWLLPYIACATMALGLVVQFLIHLVGFIRKRTTQAPA